jgi:hypothetical protein
MRETEDAMEVRQAEAGHRFGFLVGRQDALSLRVASLLRHAKAGWQRASAVGIAGREG